MTKSNDEVFLLRQVAAAHQIDVRTLKRALDGHPPRGAAVQQRAEAAVRDYNTRRNKKAGTP